MKRMIVTLLAGALLGGAATVAALTTGPVATAQSSSANEATTEETHLCHRGTAGFLRALVENETITKEQATAIRAAVRENLPERTRSERPSEPPLMTAMTAALEQLVSDGTITQAQADAVTAAAQEWREQLAERREALRERFGERLREKRERFRERLRERRNGGSSTQTSFA